MIFLLILSYQALITISSYLKCLLTVTMTITDVLNNCTTARDYCLTISLFPIVLLMTTTVLVLFLALQFIYISSIALAVYPQLRAKVYPYHTLLSLQNLTKNLVLLCWAIDNKAILPVIVRMWDSQSLDLSVVIWSSGLTAAVLYNRSSKSR